MKITKNHFKYTEAEGTVWVEFSPIILPLVGHFNNDEYFKEFQEEVQEEIMMTDDREERLWLFDIIVDCLIEYADLFFDEYGFPNPNEETMEDMFPEDYIENTPLEDYEL